MKTASAASARVTLRSMRPGDIAAVLILLRRCKGVRLRNADAPDALRHFLRRNPRLSVVAVAGTSLVGCAFVGHDGRRGYLHHVAVHPGARRQRIGTQIVDRAIAHLQARGIAKIHCDVLGGNRAALRFWNAAGWERRRDVVRFSIVTGTDPEA